MTRIVKIFLANLPAVLLGLSHVVTADAQTTLADKPIFGAADVPGNLALSLSVEFPTAISVANIGAYNDTMGYLGYFDPLKCYVYNAINSGTSTAPNYTTSYFQPYAMATGSNYHQCSGYWSGNFLNWAAMQTIDPFRWALTGGYRAIDSASQTILEKAWGPSSEGSPTENFDYRGTAMSGLNNLNNMTTPVSTLTPFTSWSTFNSGIWGNGNAMVFSQGNGYSSAVAAATDLTSVSAANTQPNTAIDTSYRVYIRVDVCDPTTPLGLSGIESNCVQYPKTVGLPPASYDYKPEGLMQQYANQIRYSVFGYLNGYGSNDQGGVLREPMGYIGPTYPQPLSTNVITNSRPEWLATTGQMISNPDTTLASASGVSQSGVMNYLNKFGESFHSYMTYDNVSELYYAAIRYYENLGNVSQWYNSASPTQLDGFPAAATWADPIAYYCQKNFILGIGDDHTWYDSNVGGGVSLAGRGAVPSAVAADTINHAQNWTTQLQTLEGISPTEVWPFDTDATYYIAGLAYGAHVNDLRPDLSGAQTISTFWMDVEEGGGPENLNPYYLATKYGGFNVTLSPPAVYNMATPLTLGQWDSSGATIPMNGGHTHYQPNNYFLAGNANAMVTGLAAAFTSISNASHNISSAYSFQAPNITSTGTESFAAVYYGGWYGEVDASTLTFDSSGNPVTTALWTTNTTFHNQLAGNGWSGNRRIATWTGSGGSPFEPTSLTSSQQTALSAPVYSPGTTYTQYVNYLRGDQSNEIGSTATPTTQSLRARTILLGDIVNASLTTVPPPLQSYSDANNPGYANFKSTTATNGEGARVTMVYAGANDGMLHGFRGTDGVEQFAYVPSALFQGPTGTPQVNGLAQLGNPNYTHHYYIDATPNAFDIDMAHTGGSTGSPNWVTLLIGGLGKGGKSFYAIDITDPAKNLTSEAAVASAVKWEFTDPTMGYSYGSAVAVKTAKYGWVAIMTSGYDNADGYGYIYFVNPATGALLEKVKTPYPSAGLTKVSAYVKDYSDETADSLYVGDLNGQLWRVDLTGTVLATPYPAPTLLAILQDPSGNVQPITTEPEIAIHPVTRKRYVMVGTGRLLASSDVSSTQMQTFYAILDGTATAFTPVSTPYTRANLTALTTSQLLNINTLMPAGQQGWYTDLGIDPTSGIGYRVIIDPVAYNGIVAFTTVLTSVSDPCAPGGSSRVYALDYSTATSVLQPSPLPFFSSVNTIIGVRVAGANGNPELVVGYNGTPAVGKVNASLTSVLATRTLNWREIPTTN
jgi:type IV pilus assembly protein PilY1